ncbi:hypothetical protein LTR94_025268 [Friedmanniomyces endolithicus]|nr:hypothetical protein LTR94_025268 [Friedmanniomyces endolithicus]
MTSVLIPAVLGGLGLIFGSFVAAVSVRLPREMDVVAQRSRCMGCEATLRPWELVPVFSWLALRGRCARCDSRISPRYPLIELGAAALGVWAGLAAPDLATAIATAALGWQLLLIALIDGENFWLPDQLTWPLAVSGLAASWCLGGLWGLTAGLIGVGFGFCSLWLVGWLYKAVRKREGLGGGDPFLLAGAGAWVGWQGLPIFGMKSGGVRLGDPTFDGEVKPSQSAHSAFNKRRLAIVSQHMLNPKHLAVIAPNRHDVENEGSCDGEGFFSGPVGLEMGGQSLKISGGGFAKRQDRLLDRLEIGVEVRRGDAGRRREIGDPDLAIVALVQKLPSGVQYGLTRAPPARADLVPQLVRLVGHVLDGRIVMASKPGLQPASLNLRERQIDEFSLVGTTSQF